MRSAFLLLSAAVLLLHGSRAAQAADPFISEFLASNDRGLSDEDGDRPDWIEIFNPAATSIDLSGWYLTDTPGNLRRWRFPAVTVSPSGYLVVFASNKNRTTPGHPLHTNFALSAAGEFLALVRPDGVTIASQYEPTFPPQITDVSYGAGMLPGTPSTLIAPGAAARAVVPVDDSLGNGWTVSDFDDGNWIAGATAAGYERASGYEQLIQLDLNSLMYGISTTAYIRIPFTVAQPNLVQSLTLRMKYDDGFVAYLNGQEIASGNAPDAPAYNSSATADRPDAQALVYQDFDISDARDVLQPGTNVLAVHGLNRTATSSDFLILPELVFTGQAVPDPQTHGYLLEPTPGGPNGPITQTVGPAIRDVAHNPPQPADGDDLIVTARIMPTFAPVGTVTLQYRIMYGQETALSMHDDGLHGDGPAGDGVYGAVIPASASTAGQMVRYFIIAADTRQVTMRAPVFGDPTGSPQYFGTVVSNPAVVTSLPVLEWFVQDPAAARTDSGTRASLYYLGEFYDNVFVRRRGGSSASWTKRSYKFDFNKGYRFRYHPGVRRVEEFNLQSTYADKAYVRQVLAYETYQNAGVPGSAAFPLRVQQNNAFHSVAIFVEQIDDRGLERNGLDPEGALYKMFNTATSATSSVEKKTRKEEDYSDLQQLIQGLQLTGEARNAFLFDHVDIPASLNYIAATALIHDNDHVAKNYYLYRDTRGTGEWMMLPWDKDLTFGRNYNAGAVLNDTIWADVDTIAGRSSVSPSHPFFGDQEHQKYDYVWNRLIDALIYVKTYALRPPDNPGTSCPGVQARYYSLTNPSVLPNFSSLTPYLTQVVSRIDYASTNGNFAGSGRADGVGAVFEGFITVPFSGIYTFSAESDDGSALYIGNQKVVDNNGIHAMTERTGGIALAAGAHRVRVEFFENTGGAGLIVRIQGPGVPRQVVPASMWSYTCGGMQGGMPAGLTENSYTDGSTRIREMYLRRLRTLMDELLQPPGTPAQQLRYETRIADLYALMQPDVQLDRAAWGNPYGQDQDFVTALNILKSQYLAVRRTHFYVTHHVNSTYALRAGIPDAQPEVISLRRGGYDISDGNRAWQYLELVNPNGYAVDISGWQVTGDIRHIFRPGTVIPSNDSIFLSPDAAAFRTRSVSPTGGEQRLVQGNYTGMLTGPVPSIWLHDARGRPVLIGQVNIADLDDDGDADAGDLHIFVACMTGPGWAYDPSHPPPGCTLSPDAGNLLRADFDRDGDVDQSDFGVFQACMSGTSVPPDSSCAAWR